MFPTINTREEKNPRAQIVAHIDSHNDSSLVTAIYYNNQFHFDTEKGKYGTRDEARITNWGGQKSALLDPENTGALAIFAFENPHEGKNSKQLRVWVAQNPSEEEAIEQLVGPADPGELFLWSSTRGREYIRKARSKKNPCILSDDQIPEDWLIKFPSGLEIVRKTLELQKAHSRNPDTLLLDRRSCEFDIFQTIELKKYQPIIQQGFGNLEEFLSLAQTVLQSRKSRSGKSLEYHTIEILKEQGLAAGQQYDHNPTIEGNKKPDFLFPSRAAYNDSSFPSDGLRMLAAKTTCKDRWRQILNEADRIPTKHLLTLQRGVTKRQFEEMKDAGVQLVVPEKLHKEYPKEIQSELQSLGSFLQEVKTLPNH
jgi:hypothetical protein